MLEIVMIVIGLAAFLVLVWALWSLLSQRTARGEKPKSWKPLVYPVPHDHSQGGCGHQQPVVVRRKEVVDRAEQAEPGLLRTFGDRGELRQELLELIEEEADVIREILSREQEGGTQSDSSSSFSARDTLSLQTGRRSDEGQVSVLDHGQTGAHLQDYSFSESCNRYNEALGNQDVRSEFRTRYDPLVISVVNAVDRRRDEKLVPVFKTASDGNFIAIKPPSGEQYEVFPKFGLILQESSFGPGAIGEVFECPDFSPRFSYPDIKVMRPAIFVPKGDEEWELKDRGVLDLGQGQET